MREKVRELGDLIKTTFTHWQEDKASRLAAALALYAILSIPPLLILVIGIAGRFAAEGAVHDALLARVEQMMGASAQEAVTMILEAANEPQGFSLATIISVAVLFFGASGVFVQLQEAMNNIWGVMPDPERGLMATIKQRILSFAIILGTGGLLILVLILSSMVSMLAQFLSQLLPFSITWAQLLNFGVTFLLVTGLIALIFKAIPEVEIAWRDVLVGSLVTALLFVLGMFGISYYVRYSDPTSSYGAAGSLIVLLLWVYYSAQIIFLGAEFTQVFANRYGGDIEPGENAVYIPRARLRRRRSGDETPEADISFSRDPAGK